MQTHMTKFNSQNVNTKNANISSNTLLISPSNSKNTHIPLHTSQGFFTQYFKNKPSK